jgi:hypothetical protein
MVATPNFSARRPAIRTATMTPIAIMSPYALSRNGPIDNDPLDGLGMDDRIADVASVSITQ